MRIAITGATGLLGRNLLFEIIKQNLDNLDTLEIFVLGREKNNLNIEQRIEDIILNDGLLYFALDTKEKPKIKYFCKNKIKCIEADLDKEKLGSQPANLKEFKAAPIDFFFHIAALTDFRDSPHVVDALKRTNIHGTKQILQLISNLKIGEFCYVGSAYSCGETTGDIKPDYINSNQKFRNPYEKTKLEAEIIVRDFAKKTKIRCRYFRPSTICGRLIEAPLGAVSKFDVFYSWAAFFLRMKLKRMKTFKDEYIDPVDLNIRISYNLKSGLNIVSADYAAKLMYKICMQDDIGENYHLVNKQETPHGLYIPVMLNILNIKGTKQTNNIPDDKNVLEELYYKTVGVVFTPYITSEPMLFDIRNLENIMKSAELHCPPVDEKNFTILINYAKQYNFGLKSKFCVIKFF